MSPDDNDDTKLSGLADTPEMRRLLETVSNLSPEKRRRLERLVESAIMSSDSEELPSEDEEPK